MADAYAYCEALVREHDRDQFLATLHAPADRRPHLYAIAAFALEIARVPHMVRDPMAGEIRFQWWREVLAGERREEAAANPVAAAFLTTIKQYELQAEMLSHVIDARGFDLLAQPMPSHQALREYVHTVFGIPLLMRAAILAPQWNAPEILRDGAQAGGITEIVRNFARNISEGRLFIPLDILAQHGVHTASVMNREASAELSAVLQALRKEALAAFDRLRAAAIPQAAMPAFLSLALVPDQLRLLAAGTDPFETTELSRLRRVFAVWRAARRGRF